MHHTALPADKLPRRHHNPRQRCGASRQKHVHIPAKRRRSRDFPLHIGHATAKRHSYPSAHKSRKLRDRRQRAGIRTCTNEQRNRRTAHAETYGGKLYYEKPFLGSVQHKLPVAQLQPKRHATTCNKKLHIQPPRRSGIGYSHKFKRHIFHQQHCAQLHCPRKRITVSFGQHPYARKPRQPVYKITLRTFHTEQIPTAKNNMGYRKNNIRYFLKKVGYYLNNVRYYFNGIRLG